MTDEDFMARAIALSERALDEEGVRPFGAVVVRDGRIVGEGVNRAVARLDPTSHGEVEAIRAACVALGATSLKGCTIYTSCEPCSMCASVILIAELDAVVYAASVEDSAAVWAEHPTAPRAHSLTMVELRNQVGLPIDDRRPPSRRALGGRAVEVLRAYAAKISP